MKKKGISVLLCCTLLLSAGITAFADEKDDRIAELEAQVAELEKTVADLQEELSKYTSGTEQEEYGIGETWTVPGQWSLTINSVEETTDRNEFADQNPAAVYIVTYTYENIGYEDDLGIMDGLYIDLSDGIMDSTGKMGYSYPGDITLYPQETPVGGTCEAQSCIGVDNPGDFKIYFTTYDGTGTKQEAVFSLAL